MLRYVTLYSFYMQLFSYLNFVSFIQGRGVESESGSFSRETRDSGHALFLDCTLTLVLCRFGGCIYSSCRCCYLKRVLSSCHFVAADVPVVLEQPSLHYTINMSHSKSYRQQSRSLSDFGPAKGGLRIPASFGASTLLVGSFDP